MSTLSRRTIFSSLTSALVCYTLVLVLLPLSPISATPRSRSNKPNVPTHPNPQVAARREGELLIRFRAGVSAQNKDTVLASHGVRRKKQLRGESSIEKLEVVGGQSVETVALQLSLNPEVEFAEPNFLIDKDDLGTSDPRFDDQ